MDFVGKIDRPHFPIFNFAWFIQVTGGLPRNSDGEKRIPWRNLERTSERNCAGGGGGGGGGVSKILRGVSGLVKKPLDFTSMKINYHSHYKTGIWACEYKYTGCNVGSFQWSLFSYF